MSAPKFNQQEHLIYYLNIIRKRKWIVVTIFLFVVCTVAVKTYTTTPIYSATARIIFEGKSEVVDLANVQAISKSKGYQETLLELLRSRGLVKDLINDQKLREALVSNKEQPDYLAKKFKDIKKISTRTLDKVISYFKFLPPSSPRIPNTRSKLLEEHAEHVLKKSDPLVNYYLGKLKITPIIDTFLVDIKFENRSPELAAHIVNTHVNAFIVRSKRLQQEASQNALNWLKKQLREHKIKMEKSQNALKKYTYQQLESLSISDEHLLTLPEIKALYAFNTLRKDLVELKAQKIEMSTKYGSKHPKVIEINSNIKQFEQMIKGELAQLKRSIKLELEQVAKKDIKSQEAQKQATELYDKENSNYGILELEAESDKEIYDILVKQAKEINLTGNIEGHNIRMVEKAEIPRGPIRPKVFTNIILSIVMGLTFGVGFAFFVEYMVESGTIPEETMSQLGIPVIGVLPYDKLLKGNKPLALPLSSSRSKQKKKGKYFATYNISASLAMSLPLKRSRKAGQVFMVESATANEGKSTVLAKSAVSLAKGGLRVVMVDADLQRPTLHKIFGLNNGETCGLVNAQKNILSHKILKGSLDEYSLDDLFSLIDLRSQSGRLTITNSDQVMTAVFENGHLIQLQSNEIPFDNRLGTMLLRGGFINESQLKDALARNKRTKQPLGYILINAGYINQDKLRGPVKLQVEECIHKLFSWKQGMFVFEQGNIETYEDKRIYFQEDYLPIIKRLGRTTGSRFLEKETLSYIKSVDELNLSLLPAGIGNEYECEGLLNHAVVTEILNILKQHFDVVLVDSPPVLEAMGSAKTLASLSDGIIFVVKSGSISIRNIENAIQCMKEGNAEIIGTVLNQVKKSSSYNYY